MLIDWFTLAAQAVNFLILVGLLRWLLYPRIIDAMDRREEEISSRLDDARRQREETENYAREYERKQQDLERERESVRKEAQEEAAQRRDELLAEAREEADEARRKWSENLRRQKESFLAELRDRAGRESLALTRQTLEDMAGATLESQMTTVFTRRLRELDPEKRREIADALRSTDGNPVVRSAFELPRECAAGIKDALAELLPHDSGKENPDLKLEWETEPELVCGIELEARGSKIGWSIDDHLDRLKEDFDRLLEEETRRNAPRKTSESTP